MSNFKTKSKLNILSLIVAAAFVIIVFSPYVSILFYSILNGLEFTLILENFFATVFNLSNTLNFLACIAIAVGVFTKFDKFTTAGGTAIFWLSGIVSFITLIVNAISHRYTLAASTVLSSLLNICIYFIIFAISATLAVFLIIKKPAPSFVKYLIFIPIGFFVIMLFISIFGGIIDFIKYLFGGYMTFRGFISQFASLIFNPIGSLIRTVGFAALLIKISEFKIKKKQTEIYNY